VDWAVRQIENEADVLETVVPELDDDAVRILTVHGSKGLDFPITIVSGLASMAGDLRISCGTTPGSRRSVSRRTCWRPRARQRQQVQR
jgi:hypothetical protein